MSEIGRGTYTPVDTGGEKPKSPKLIPDGDTALADLREISRSPDGLIEVRRLIDEGTPLLRAHIDQPSAGITGDLIARYEVCEPLKVFLAAMRARDRQTNEIEGGHDDPPTKGDARSGEIFSDSVTEDAKEFPPYINPDDVLAAVIGLFARVPSLPQQLLNLSKVDELTGKPRSFFDDLFVAAPRPAVGANYYVVSYRLRNPDEWNFVNGAKDGNLANVDGAH